MLMRKAQITASALYSVSIWYVKWDHLRRIGTYKGQGHQDQHPQLLLHLQAIPSENGTFHFHGRG